MQSRRLPPRISAPGADEGGTGERGAHGPWMAVNAARHLPGGLETGHNESRIDPPIREMTVVSIQGMPNLAAERKRKEAT